MEVTDIKPNTPEWLEWRKGGVGASAVGTLCGLNGYGPEKQCVPYNFDGVESTPETLWKRETGQLPPAEYNEHMKRGHDNEEAILKKYRKTIGSKVRECGPWMRPDYEWAKVTPDGKVEKDARGDGEGIIEIKCPLYDPMAVKLDHFCQMQYQMWVTGNPLPKRVSRI